MVQIQNKQEQERAFNILTPDDYKAPESPYVLREILNIADNCEKINLRIGNHIIVERRMLHKIELSGKTFYLVLENYIYGRLYR